MSETNGLVASGVVHAFAGAKVLEGIEIRLPRGGVLAILGPSGGGKTTLLHILGGVIEPDAGRIERPFEQPAFVFQDPLLLPWRTARGNVAFGLAAQRLTRTERSSRVRSMLLKVGLGQDEAGLYPHQLSGGMRKRVALARALATEPDLLLLDEAFSALDVGLSREMQQLVRLDAQERNVTVVLVTHDLSEAVRLADRIVILAGRPGRIVARLSIDRPARLRDDPFVDAEIRRIAAQETIRDAFRPTLSG